MKSQFTKIFVERDQNPVLSLCAIENLRVSDARRIVSYPGHIMPLLTQCSYCIAWKVLVRKKLHKSLIGSRKCIYFFQF